MTDDLSYYQHGDEPDAANFAAAAAIVGQLSDRTGRAGYIVHGFELTPDLNNLEVNIGGGTALILRKDYTTVSPNIDPSRTYTWTAHPVHKEGVTQLALEDNAVNHIFLDVNVSTRDTPLTFLNQSGDYPSDESIKIGEIDTNEDTVDAATSEQWHLVAVDGSLTYPDQNAAAESASDLPDGTAVFDRKDGVFWRVESGGLEPYVDTGEIATDAITVDELDQSIAPTWTGEHTFSGGVTGLPAPTVGSDAARQQDVDSGVESHRATETHDQPQPNQAHGNEDHNETYTTAGDDVENFSTSGAADTVPVSQGDGTLSMQNVTQAIEFLDVESPYELPDPGSVSKPTIAYVDSEDDYVGVFKQ